MDGFHCAAAEMGAKPAAADADGAPAVAKSFPVDDNQVLYVVLAADGTAVRAERWQVLFTGEWVPDDAPELGNGFAEQQE